MKKRTILIFASILFILLTKVGFSQVNKNFELSGVLSPDKTQMMGVKRTVSLTINDGGTGPYKSIMTNDVSLSTHTIFRPSNLSAFGKDTKLPIVAYGNGGCANSPEQVLEVLSEIASHGFLVIAIGPVKNAVFGSTEGMSMTDSKLLLDAIDWATAQNSNPESPYFGKIAIDKIGVMGQSCGGLQALTVSADPRISTTICLNSGVLNQPMNLPANLANPTQQSGNAPKMSFPSVTKNDLAKLHAPVIYLVGGEYDIATPNGSDDFAHLDQIPVFLASYDFTEQVKATGNKGLGHFPATYMEPHGGDFIVAAVAWLKWQLKGDVEASKMFKGKSCGLQNNSKWTISKKNID